MVLVLPRQLTDAHKSVVLTVDRLIAIAPPDSNIQLVDAISNYLDVYTAAPLKPMHYQGCTKPGPWY